MRAGWDGQDLRLAVRGQLKFAAEQAELIRARLTRIWTQLHGPVSERALGSRPAGRHHDEEVRHKETHCTGAERNGPKQTEALVERTRAKLSGTKETGIQTPLSGPRYRGSNPCLPATTTANNSVPIIDSESISQFMAHVLGRGFLDLQPDHKSVRHIALPSGVSDDTHDDRATERRMRHADELLCLRRGVGLLGHAVRTCRTTSLPAMP
jgi:hypothetical protein